MNESTFQIVSYNEVKDAEVELPNWIEEASCGVYIPYTIEEKEEKGEFDNWLLEKGYDPTTPLLIHMDY